MPHDRELRVSCVATAARQRKGWKALLARRREHGGELTRGTVHDMDDGNGVGKSVAGHELRVVSSDVLKGHTASVLALAALGIEVAPAAPEPGGPGIALTRVASASYDGTVRLWRLAARHGLAGGEDSTGGSATPLGQSRAKGGARCVVDVLSAHAGPVTGLAAWPSRPAAPMLATRLASASRDGSVCMWDVERPQPRPGLLTSSHCQPLRRWLMCDGQPVTCVAFYGDALPGSSPGSGVPLVMSGSGDGVVQVWDAREPSLQRAAMTLRGHKGAVTALLGGAAGIPTSLPAHCPSSTSPACTHSDAASVVAAASASEDGTVRLLDLRGATGGASGGSGGACHSVLDGHSGPITCMQQHWAQLITGSQDCTVKAWNVHTGECTRSFYGHVGAVSCLAGDDSCLVSASWDGSVRMWN